MRIHRSTTPLLSVSCSLLVPACGWIEPIPSSDAGVIVVVDAEVQDATGEDDGAVHPAADAAVDAPPDADAETDAFTDASADGGPACSADRECEADRYCSRVSHSCVARCGADGACIGPAIAIDNNRIVTDGTSVCYAADAQDDGAAPVALRAWDAVAAEPTTLAHGTGLLALLIADGHCYFHADGALQRAPLAGGPVESVDALAAAPVRVWLTPHHVWWASVEGELRSIHRLARAAAGGAELVATTPAAQAWEVGNETQLFRRFNPVFGSCALATAPIADLTQETVIPMSFSKNCQGELWANDASILFTQYLPVYHYLYRLDLAQPSVENSVALSSVELLMYQVRGDWVYGQRVVDGSSVSTVPSTVSYIRAPFAGGERQPLFTPTPGTASFRLRPPPAFTDNVYRTFAVLDGDKLVYSDPVELRLRVKQLTQE